MPQLGGQVLYTPLLATNFAAPLGRPVGATVEAYGICSGFEG